MDICPDHKPDIVASMTNMGDIGQYDAVYCSHALEHLRAHEVPQALSEFRRVLVPGGYAVIYVPDLEDVNPTDDLLYMTMAGAVTGSDMFYGFAAYVKDNPYMEHHSGFVEETLVKKMKEAGFETVMARRAGYYNLLGVGVKHG